jgi:hypothetical protein
MTNASGIVSDYLPQIHPDHAPRSTDDDLKSVLTGKSQNTSVSKLARAHADPEDDDLFFSNDALDDSEVSIDTQNARFVLGRGIYTGDDLEREEIWYFDHEYNHLNEKRMPGASNLEHHALSWWVCDDHDKNIEINEDVSKINDRMLFCLKTIGNAFADDAENASRPSVHLTPIAARFWNGSFGVKAFEDVVKGILRRGLDENFMFRAVHARKELCDAMYRRDKNDIERILSEIKTAGFSGGSAVDYAGNKYCLLFLL